MAQEFSAAKHARAKDHAQGRDQRFPGKGNAGKCRLHATINRAAEGGDGREVAWRFGRQGCGLQGRAIAFQHRKHIGRTTFNRHRITRAQYQNGAGAIHRLNAREINDIWLVNQGARHCWPKRGGSFGIQPARKCQHPALRRGAR